MITGENLSSSVALSNKILQDFIEMFNYLYFGKTLILLAVMSIYRPLAGL